MLGQLGYEINKGNIPSELVEEVKNGSENPITNEDLHDSNFTGAKLVDATLSGAIIKGANLTKADLKNVNGLTKEQFYSAKNRQKALNIPPRLL